MPNWIPQLLRSAQDIDISAEMATVETIKDERSSLEKAMDTTGHFIVRLDGKIADLEADIARMTEELRQSRVVRDGYATALGIMQKGRDA